MPKIFIYNDGDEYVGTLQDCEVIIVPDTTPDSVLGDRRRGSHLTERLTAENVPHLHVGGPADHAEVKSKILEALRTLSKMPNMEIDCAKALAEIDQYENK